VLVLVLVHSIVTMSVLVRPGAPSLLPGHPSFRSR
jgi:hypothetical protein